MTYEFENVPVDAARFVETLRPVFPPPAALEAAQDRLSEKQLFDGVGLEVPPYAPVDSLDALTDALAHIGTPAVLKTRRLGYDGKGQAVIHDAALAEDAWRSIGEVPALLEAFVPFDREVSIVAVRGRDGAFAAYPLVENHHRDGILRLTLAPAPDATDAMQTAAERHARTVMDSLGYVGVLAIELFCVGERLLGERDGPPRAQQRPLDRRRRRDQPVREPSARDRGAAARLDRTRRRERHGEPDRRGARSSGDRRRSTERTCTTTARSRGRAARWGTSRSVPTIARPWNRGCSACSSWSRRSA